MRARRYPFICEIHITRRPINNDSPRILLVRQTKEKQLIGSGTFNHQYRGGELPQMNNYYLWLRFSVQPSQTGEVQHSCHFYEA